MISHHTLLLASKSPSRHMLLQLARIPFAVIGQDADETSCDWTLPLQDVVTQIALFKMKHAVVPLGTQGQTVYVLTADTLTQGADGTIYGKPVDREDAKRMLKQTQTGSRVATAFCLEKRKWLDGAWVTQQQVLECVTAAYVFNVPDELLDYYLDNSPGVGCANATAVEGFGLQFLESVNGSYTAIIGLPLFELRIALKTIGFFAAD